MEYLILLIIINLLIIFLVAYVIIKNIKQKKLNRLLINYKSKNNLIVYKKSSKNKWHYRLAYIATFSIIFNSININLFIQNPQLYGAFQNKLMQSDSAFSSSNDAAYSQDSNAEANYCVYDEEKSSYILTPSCTIPSSSIDSTERG